MPAKLPDNIKSIVIQQWLQGNPRNDIASNNGLSSGAVTNIVNEWRRRLGFAAIDEFRELAVTMKKVGVSAAQCALGFRIATIIIKTGINEDSFEKGGGKTFTIGAITLVYHHRVYLLICRIWLNFQAMYCLFPRYLII